MERDFISFTEIAAMTGTTSQVVASWRARSADFPRPLSELGSGLIFRGSQIRAWLVRNNHKLRSLQEDTTFYSRLKSYRNDDHALSNCIARVVGKLEANETSESKPGMLLGKIQSGKTRAFVGVIAHAFDRGVDIALVLTKGTKTLSAQTVSRLATDFAEFIDEDELVVLDIMKLPKLTRSELRRKIVVVAKKQANNLNKLIDFLKNHEALQDRKMLLIDDEADLASIRFISKPGEPTVKQGTIADQIDELRGLSKSLSFLQVTATPYSLYLQPEGYEEAADGDGYIFKPKRPAFTELLPIHGGYVGGDDYFGDFDDSDPRNRLFVEVSSEEQDALRKPDKRRISFERVLDGPNTAGIRRAVVTFVVAVGVRQWQQRVSGGKARKYSMIIHNDTQKSAHAWQDCVIDWIFKAIIKAAEENPELLRSMVDDAFDDIESSVTADSGRMPSRDEAFDIVIDALQSDDIVVE